MRPNALIGCAAVLAAAPTLRASEPRFRLEGGATFARFEQQVKPEVGGAKGEKLVEETQLGYLQTFSYRFWGPLSGGVFMQLDAGRRESARFAGFDAEGRATTSGRVGGSYLELWMGPYLRVDYRSIFAELGYGAYGSRADAARDDLPSETGDRSSALRTSPTIAWSLALGARVELAPAVDLVVRMQYRVRYYVRRGGSSLDGVVHGTQNFTPFIGLSWSFGRL